MSSPRISYLERSTTLLHLRWTDRISGSDFRHLSAVTDSCLNADGDLDSRTTVMSLIAVTGMWDMLSVGFTLTSRQGKGHSARAHGVEGFAGHDNTEKDASRSGGSRSATVFCKYNPSPPRLLTLE